MDGVSAGGRRFPGTEETWVPERASAADTGGAGRNTRNGHNTPSGGIFPSFILISLAFLLYRFYFFLTTLISASHFHLPDLFYHIHCLIKWFYQEIVLYRAGAVSSPFYVLLLFWGLLFYISIDDIHLDEIDFWSMDEKKIAEYKNREKKIRVCFKTSILCERR